MGEHIEQQGLRGARTALKRQSKLTTATTGRRLLEIVVYQALPDRRDGDPRRSGGDAEIGDWMMPQFKTACAYAASQGWLIVQDDVLTLTTAGLRAA